MTNENQHTNIVQTTTSQSLFYRETDLHLQDCLVQCKTKSPEDRFRLSVRWTTLALFILPISQHLPTFGFKVLNIQESVGLSMNLLRKSHFCSFFRLFSLNSHAIRLKQSKNCPKNGFLSLRLTKSDRLLETCLLLCSVNRYPVRFPALKLPALMGDRFL